MPVSLHAIHHDLPEFALYLVAPGGRPPGNRGAHPLDLSRRELHEAVTRPALAQRIHVLTGKAEAGDIVNPCWFREHACGRDRFTLPQRRGVLDARDEMCGGDADARGDEHADIEPRRGIENAHHRSTGPKVAQVIGAEIRRGAKHGEWILR